MYYCCDKVRQLVVEMNNQQELALQERAAFPHQGKFGMITSCKISGNRKINLTSIIFVIQLVRVTHEIFILHNFVMSSFLDANKAAKRLRRWREHKIGTNTYIYHLLSVP